MDKIASSEITPPELYFSRRKFLAAMGLTAGAALLAACSPGGAGGGGGGANSNLNVAPSGAKADELGASLTPYGSITNYNNYYEFSETKQEVAPLSKNFNTTPW